MTELTINHSTRHLDFRIAELVFERDPEGARVDPMNRNGERQYHWGYPLGHDFAPEYSTSLDAAMLIVEHYKKKGCTWKFEAHPAGGWRCWLSGPVGDGFTESGYEYTLPLAICRCVLSEFGE